jgi:thiamine-phosphate pyrophosphorylase
MFSLPSTLYPITDVKVSGLSHAEQVARLIDGGATLIQLREKRLSPREFFRDAAQALIIARSHGVQIIINDRVDIALALGADGVHLGQNDLPAEAARKLLGTTAVIGYSVHSAAQANAAVEMPIDYLGIGPVFRTLTKAAPDPVIGFAGLHEAREIAKQVPLVAIGGITPANASTVLEAGVDAVAMIRALLERPLEITARTQEFLSLSAR